MMPKHTHTLYKQNWKKSLATVVSVVDETVTTRIYILEMGGILLYIVEMIDNL
jgi:hypothetical protein